MKWLEKKVPSVEGAKKCCQKTLILSSFHVTFSRHLRPWCVHWQEVLERPRGACSPAVSVAISREKSGSNQRAAWRGEKFHTAGMGHWVGKLRVLVKISVSDCTRRRRVSGGQTPGHHGGSRGRDWLNGTRRKQESAHPHCGSISHVILVVAPVPADITSTSLSTWFTTRIFA